MDATIRAYDPIADEQGAYALWQAAVGRQWPLSRATFRATIMDNPVYRAGDHLVAIQQDRVVGFAATQVALVPGEADSRGSLLAVLVAPERRRQGLGRALHDRALAHLARRGATQVQLGGGGFSYFWQGVPANLPEGWAFFAACGWQDQETSYDLLLDLHGYATPPWVHERARQAGVEIRCAEATETEEILAFEERHFPRWRQFFALPVASGEVADIVVARDHAGALAGTALVSDDRSRWERPFVWSELYGARTGGVGTLGVAEAYRERGIGLALAATATELLAQRGVARSYIGWTWLVDWYGKLGYRVCQEQRLCWRQLAADAPADPPTT